MRPAPVDSSTFYARTCTTASRPQYREPRWFDNQAEAFERADQSASDGLFFWSSEEPTTRRRRFASETLRDFWEWYKREPPHERHCYELLREGRPSHLYLDIEYSRPANPGVDGDELVHTLVAALKSSTRSRLGVDVSQVVELDSTTDVKFSRHIILRLANNAAFASNLAAGAFLHSVWKEVTHTAFLVRKPDGDGETPIFDAAVYSRNRAFRLYLSTKAGKAARLLPTATSWLLLRGTQPRPGELVDIPHWWLFLASLACNVSSDATLFGEVQPERNLVPVRRALTSAHAEGASSAALSAFPHTTALVSRWAAARDCSAAAVRTCQAHKSRGLLLLGLSGTRFCGNVQRQHRSNGVYVVVDFRENCFYQKCHDPDCRGYRSPPEQLTEEAWKEGGALQDAAIVETAALFDAWLLNLTPTELEQMDAIASAC